MSILKNSLSFILRIFIYPIFIFLKNSPGNYGVVPYGFRPGAPGIDILGKTFRIESLFVAVICCPPEIKAEIVAINSISDIIIVDAGFLTGIYQLLYLCYFPGNCPVLGQFNYFCLQVSNLSYGDIGVIRGRSQRSPDGMKCNPGFPDSALLHPGYITALT